MVKYLRAANVKDGKLDLSDVKSMNFTPDEQRIFALRPGDVLVTEGSGSLSSVGASAVWQGEIGGPVCFQNTLLRMRPRSGLVDGRFLGWWAQSAFGSGVFASLASGANIYHLSAERVRALRVHLPSIDEQRRIADLLDTKTAHIDKLIKAREAQHSMLDERERSSIDQAFDRSRSSQQTRLKYLMATRPRYGVLVPEFSDDGVPFLRVNDLNNLQKGPNQLPRIPVSLSAKYPRTIVRPGDLLVSVVGTLGRTAIATKSLAGANIARAVCSIRVAPGVEVDLVHAWIKSGSFQKQAHQATSTDTAQPTLGMEDISNFLISWPTSRSDRERTLKQIMSAQESVSELKVRLTQQQGTLAERRKALVTAAVTGRIAH
ncbi:hypothetical protein O7606_12405 [Micromonospora sp. WMMD882]|uniref:restriction endonuclease subunit S n=1 Tax=Micromonospora sp. WMMD882 TaxID=3015151 RepID=UPI00248CF13A|nr:hypothetical protein [Micromonospora sp. WMMD882]WBB82091.1 hypothetical protein O7606_12405 [Micromonospora sp. WMMD882]